MRSLALILFCGSVLLGQATPAAELHADRGLKFLRAGDLARAEVELRQAVKLRPHDPALLAELGVVLGMEQKLGESNRYFEEALRYDPGDVSIRRNLAKNQWRLGEATNAERNFQEVLKVQPGDRESTLILGMVEENLRHFTAAARLLSSVPALVSQHPEAVIALARAYYQTQDSAGARQTLRGLVATHAPPPALYGGGQAALEAEDFSTAEELFVAARPGYPDRAKLGYFLAYSRYRGGKFPACQSTVLETLAAGAATRDLYVLLGWCYARQDKLEDSARAFDRAVALDPANETTYLDLGTVLLDHRKEELALALGKETAAKFPESYRALMLKGTAEADLGYLTDAVDSFKRAVELNPNCPEANYNLAVAQSVAGFSHDALVTLERGIQKFPRDALHYQEYASAEIRQAEGGEAGAEGRAYVALHKALSLDNRLAQAHLLLGKLELKNQRTRQAVSELETAAKLDPHDGTIHLALSRAYARLGVADQAAKERETYENSARAELQGSRGRTPVALRRW